VHTADTRSALSLVLKEDLLRRQQPLSTFDHPSNDHQSQATTFALRSVLQMPALRHARTAPGKKTKPLGFISGFSGRRLRPAEPGQCRQSHDSLLVHRHHCQDEPGACTLDSET